MKMLACVRSLFVLAGLCLTSLSYGGEIIFRPAPGLNDGTDTGTLTAGKDASGGSCSSPADNAGSGDLLYSGPQSTCNGCNYSTWLQFDVNPLPSNVTRVYVGFTHLPHTTYCYSNCNADFYFYPVTSDWNEMTVSRATPPTRGSAMVGPVNISFPNDFGNREYEITDLYRQWKSGAIVNRGLEISSPTVGCSNASVAFLTYSSDSATESLRPYLRIITVDPVPAQSTQWLMLTILMLVGMSALWLHRTPGIPGRKR